MNKKTGLLVLAALFVGLCLAIGFVLTRPPKHTVYTETSPKEAERGGPRPIALLEGEKLGKLLLNEQYIAAKDALLNYAYSTYGKSTTTLSIVGEPVIQPDGTITAVINVDGTDKQFTIQLVRRSFDVMVFSVPANHYSKTISVFSVED
jgi:hypothetical protein